MVDGEGVAAFLLVVSGGDAEAEVVALRHQGVKIKQFDVQEAVLEGEAVGSTAAVRMGVGSSSTNSSIWSFGGRSVRASFGGVEVEEEGVAGVGADGEPVVAWGAEVEGVVVAGGGQGGGAVAGDGEVWGEALGVGEGVVRLRRGLRAFGRGGGGRCGCCRWLRRCRDLERGRRGGRRGGSFRGRDPRG